VHVPSDGNPLKGYELARADIEKRGDDASPTGLSGLFASLFRSKSNDDEDEGSITPVAKGKPAPAAQLAAAIPAKSADPVPVPRAKPAAATLRLASADVHIVQPANTKPEPSVTVGRAEAKPQTPADIINARGFWGDAPTTSAQASPAQAGARQALAAADPQPTASVSAAFQALAYAPASSLQVERANVVAASAPIPRSIRPASAPRNPNAATTIDMVVAKGPQGQGNAVAPSTRLASFKGNDTWMRVMMLAPSASTSMSTTVLGDTDLTIMRAHFVKPQAVIVISFSNDPQMGMVSDRFTGSATAGLATQSLVMRTASLR
jgi:hypothetical protein